MKEKLSKKNQSVEKVLRIIEFMCESGGPMRLQDLARSLELPQSTALRFLNTLMQNGYVCQDPDSLKYYLSMKLCKLGNMVSTKIDFRGIVRPFMEELAAKCEESVCLAIENNMEMVYIDFVDGPDKMLRTLQRIGRTAPMHCTGVGKVHLLNYDCSMLNQYIQLKGLNPLTNHSITTREALVVELEKIRKQGFAIDDEECENGARCLAAPIYDFTGKIVGAISVSGPTNRMTYDRLTQIKDTVVQTAKRISNQLS
ncbi:MAG: IclR family transcriptional regulator [Oscillospiraceae bacterium]